MFVKTLAVATAFVASSVMAAEVPITGEVTSKCSIYTDTAGVYGNPSPSTLSTASADGGVVPVVRYDVILADAYKARISTPESFTTSPTLTDALTWSGSVEVGQVSDTAMAGYEAAKVTYNNTTEYDMTVAGSTWFKVNSEVSYGVDKALPGGTYKAVVTAECIAK